VHLLDGDISDESRVTPHTASPDVGHASAACYFEQLVATAYDEARARLFGHCLEVSHIVGDPWRREPR
jgi:hypothetical protein